MFLPRRFLAYIHVYPAKDNCVDALRTQKINGMTYSSFMRNVMPLARNWNVAIDHIDCNDLVASIPW